MIEAAKLTVKAPSGTSIAIASGRLGAAAASRARAPKPVAANSMKRRVIRSRAPVTSAPITEPSPIATASAVYAVAPPSKAKRARSGRMTWKLNARVPTSAIIARGTSSAG